MEASDSTVKWSQKAGIIIAYIICAVAAFNIIVYLVFLFTDWMTGLNWVEYLNLLLYHILVILFTWLCVVHWLKQGRLTTAWMLLSMLLSAVIVYWLLALTCKWEPGFIRHHGMYLYAPWWLGGEQQFFKDLTPETVPQVHEINVLGNNIFIAALVDYLALFIWATSCFLGTILSNRRSRGN